jgi:hypothetical protein
MENWEQARMDRIEDRVAAIVVLAIITVVLSVASNSGT